MQIDLSFIFPHVLRELPVNFLIPLPAQRPRTVANLAFMCTGQLPLADTLLSALRLSPADIAYATLDNAKAAGLVPFSDSAVIRIDKSTVIEIGSSTTHSIFGGFVPDEALQLPADTVARGQSIAATMSSLKAGTLLYGNLGIPNSQASRYYILLNSLTTADQREEFSGFAPLGMVTSGLAELQRAASQTAVQPRTLVPKKKVVVSACRVQLDDAQLLSSLSSSSPSAAVAAAAGGVGGASTNTGERRKAEPHERVAGRVRHRDDEEDDEEMGKWQADPQKAAETGSRGFFQMSARFPKAVAQAVAVSGGGAALKRRRAEAYVTGADGVPVLRTTAIAPGEQSGSGADGGGTFQFFQVQQDAFMNDIEGILSTQQQRQHRNSNKSRKKQSYSKAGRHGGPQKRGGSGGSSSQHPASKTSQSKKVRRRY
ncbi:hypothetical protein ABB37_08600 [Leptomonas pyrrhocoris]|uniref:PPIase cyclophilin-type domain-containing protein n=1 Tax=Leptomonas pyrrhocoris TaxID=157538 RepID=A0A0M9FSP8_LEPPY|nr:hypothetical protein ABB37_08600 [Leptomonas pyrrhocoris]KPA75300.1 hypothetical protein ABB37_08600 [Leptomonas pyrrhocoris]|eukprot:XP_015653739.1 hypothetical protein ABB37_08600 [Leptomonas pyrrhocoris]